MSVNWRIAQLFETLWRIRQKIVHGTEGYKDLLKKHNMAVLVWLYGLTPQKFYGLDVVEIGGGLHGILPFLEGANTKINIDPLAHEGIWFDNVVFMKARAENCPLPDHSADVVFCSNVLNHVYDDREVLIQIQRILRPSGYLYLDVHIQPKSLNHPYEYDSSRLSSLVSDYFQIEKEWMSSTWKLAGERSSNADVPIWACKARRRALE